MKNMTAHSIFNDVLGPIMAGPSSSHSAGCARIGLTVRNLFGRKIEKAVVIFDAAGSYPSTYIGQGSNFGFTGGLLGMTTDDPRLKDAVQIAVDKGVDICFSKEMLSHTHPNEARIDVYGNGDKVEMSALTLSTGGGTFKITALDGFPVSIDGSTRMSFVEYTASDPDRIIEKIRAISGHAAVQTVWKTHEAPNNSNPLSCMIWIEGLNAREEAAIDALKEERNVWAVRHTGNVLPVSMRPQKEQKKGFYTATEALVFAKNTGKTVTELAIDYETSVGQISKDEVLSLAEQTLKAMGNTAYNPPDPKDTKAFGFLPYRACEMRRTYESGSKRLADIGCLNKAMLYAVSVMENSCAHNTIVAAPTAGSSGVVPAAIFALSDSLGLTHEEEIKGLLSSGLTGAFIANQATFGAEVAGCQAENGSASAMAASGIVAMLGGNIYQGFKAASMALQNMLGLICDPVGGLTEIPCINRNVSAVANAMAAANMVMLGFDPVIPLDETIKSMYEVGQQLPDTLRCTCGGGLCTTPTGKYFGCSKLP